MINEREKEELRKKEGNRKKKTGGRKEKDVNGGEREGLN